MPKNTPLIAGAIVIIIAVLVGGYLVMNKKSTGTSQESSTASQDQKSKDSGSVKNSIKSLLAGGKNVSCSVRYPMGETSLEGKVYVSANKMRGDYATTIDGKVMETHMISDGTYSYSWSSGTPQGVKMKIDEAQTAASPVAGQQQQVDIDQQVDMDCASWGVDNSMFTPPADVKFMDLSSITKPVSSPANQGTQQLKQDSSVCDQITDPAAKAACQGSGY